MRIFTDLIPKTTDAYTVADLGMIATLVNMVGQDYDRAVDVLMSDHDDIRTILREAEPHVGDERLKQAIALVLASRPEGFRVRQLSARADAVMKVLIALHEAVEQAQAEGARWASSLNLKIWTFLDNYVARRIYQSTF